MPEAAAETQIQRIERILDPELAGPNGQNPTFVWRIPHPEEPGQGTTMARIEVEADSLVTLANSAERDQRLGDRLVRDAGHILTYMGSIERSLWEIFSRA